MTVSANKGRRASSRYGISPACQMFLSRTKSDMPVRCHSVMRHVVLCLPTLSSDIRIKGSVPYFLLLTSYFLLLTFLLSYFLTFLLSHFLTFLLPYFLTFLLPYFLTSLLPYFLASLLPYFLTSLRMTGPSHSFLTRTSDMPVRCHSVMRHVVLCLPTLSSDIRIKGSVPYFLLLTFSLSHFLTCYFLTFSLSHFLNSLLTSLLPYFLTSLLAYLLTSLLPYFLTSLRMTGPSHSFLTRTSDMPVRCHSVMRHVVLCLPTLSSDIRIKGSVPYFLLLTFSLSHFLTSYFLTLSLSYFLTSLLAYFLTSLLPYFLTDDRPLTFVLDKNI